MVGTLVLLSRVRWGAVGLGIAQAYLNDPAPISRAAVVSASVLLAAVSIPGAFARRLSPAARARLALVSLCVDFLVCTVWLLMVANDRFSTTYAIYSLVGIEAGTLYDWRGAASLLGAFGAAVAGLYVLRYVAYGYGVDAGSLLFRITVVVLITVFAAANTRRLGLERLARFEAEQRARLALERLAHHDPLTGLANRRLFFERLREAMRTAASDGSGLAVAVIDLDNFKLLNDEVGHKAGDGVLGDVAAALLGTTRAQDTVARFGGDEFVVLAPGAGGDAELETLGRRLVDAVRLLPPVTGADHHRVAASIGLARYPADAEDPDELLNRADVAMYSAKRSGTGFAVYSPSVSRPELDGDLQVTAGRLRAIYENSLDAILFTSPDGSVHAANPAACRLLGWSEDEICRQGREGLLVADADLRRLLEERTRAGHATGVVRARRSDGSLMAVTVTSAVFTDAGGLRRTVTTMHPIADDARRDRESTESPQIARRVLGELATLRQELQEIAPHLPEDVRDRFLAAITRADGLLAGMRPGVFRRRGRTGSPE